MSALHNLTLIIIRTVSWLRGLFIRGRAEMEQFQRMKQTLNIKLAGPGQRVIFLSGGNQQKVLVSKLLTVSPKVVIMDEPTRGIDIGAKTQIYHLLRRLATEGGGVIMISSELPEVVGLCDRVLVMYEGRQCGMLAGSEINEKSIIQLACLREYTP